MNDNWPEHAGSLPTQRKFDAAVADGKVVYGPFAGYEPPRA